jgi:hypothetical protein
MHYIMEWKLTLNRRVAAKQTDYIIYNYLIIITSLYVMIRKTAEYFLYRSKEKGSTTVKSSIDNKPVYKQFDLGPDTEGTIKRCYIDYDSPLMVY